MEILPVKVYRKLKKLYILYICLAAKKLHKMSGYTGCGHLHIYGKLPYQKGYYGGYNRK